jgi:predicted O-methyltransferase YrrM
LGREAATRKLTTMAFATHPSRDALGLDDPKVKATLDRLHGAARGDMLIFARALPAVVFARLRGRSFAEALAPHLDHAYIPIHRDAGRFLYLTAHAIDAKLAVEFGTSFGISAIYLAAAMRDRNGRFVGSEMLAHKITAARSNLAAAGLADYAEIREGNALETFADLPSPIDLVLLDGWKDLYLPMLSLLRPKLRRGSVVCADNIFTFKKTLAPYVAHVNDPANGFRSMTLPLGSGLEYSVCVG